MVALLEVQQGPVVAHGLEDDTAGLVLARLPADHRVGVSPLGHHVVDQLQGEAAPAQGQAVGHPAEQAVARPVAGMHDVHGHDHGRVLGPAVVVLHEGPQPGGGVGQVQGVAVLPHLATPP